MIWTKEPKEPPNYSDWKVSLVRLISDQTEGSSQAENHVVTYHVHRLLLGERSQYFERLFLSSSDCSDSISESKEGHSKILLKLSEEAFQWTQDAFEILLNQCYQNTPVVEKGIGFKILVALWSLVDYLQFTWKFRFEGQEVTVEDWMMKKMTVTRLQDGPGDSYSAVKEFRAAGFNLERVQSMIAKFCIGKGSISMSPHIGTRIADEADLTLWLEITSLLSGGSMNDDTAWSDNLAYFLEKNQVSYEVFQQLTQKSALPKIDPRAALAFLKLDKKLQPKVRDDSGNKEEECENEPVTEFQERCICALGDGDLDDPENEQLRDMVIETISKHPPLVALYVRCTLKTLQKVRRYNKDCSEKEQSERERVLEVQLRREKRKNGLRSGCRGSNLNRQNTVEFSSSIMFNPSKKKEEEQ